MARIDVFQGIPVLAHDAQEGLAILFEPGERPAMIPRDASRLCVRLTRHQRRERRREVAAGVAVVRQPA